jgi:molybdenum cofactor cytidylyltransferase
MSQPGDGDPDRSSLPVGAVVLAAGGSTRMGGTNKLLELVGGVPMVAGVVDETLDSSAWPVVVVTGHDAAAVERALGEREVRFVHNPRWALGMSTSLAAGVEALEGQVSGALVCLGDMPAVKAQDIQDLIYTFRNEGYPGACLPVYGGRRGNPVLWAARWFGALRALDGDRGARALLDDLPDRVVRLAVTDPGVLTDVDTPEALERARSAGR